MLRPTAHPPSLLPERVHRVANRLRPGLVPLMVVGGLLGRTAAAAAGQSPASAGEVTIEKATDGVDADAAPGPSVEAGRAVTWTWTVSASGSTTLYDVVVSDSGGVTPACDVTGDGQPDGTNIHPGPIEPGGSFVCTATGGNDLDPAAGTYAAVGRVRASDFGGAVALVDEDPSHHTPVAPFVAQPAVTIETLLNGQTIAGADRPLVAEGSALTWTYVVTNAGNVPISGVEVRDSSGLAVDCGDGTPVVPDILDAGARVTCTARGTAADQSAGPQSTVGAVVAAALDPGTGTILGELRADDGASYLPVQLPGRLAFTGPTDVVVPLGLALVAIGGGLTVLAGARGSRRDTAAR